MTTDTGERIRLGNRVINVNTLHEYEVTEISFGTPWLRRVNNDNELIGSSIKYDKNKHKREI